MFSKYGHNLAVLARFAKGEGGMTESKKKRISIIGSMLGEFISDILGKLDTKGGPTKSEIKDLIKESIYLQQKCFIYRHGIMKCYGP